MQLKETNGSSILTIRRGPQVELSLKLYPDFTLEEIVWYVHESELRSELAYIHRRRTEARTKKRMKDLCYVGI